MTVKKAGVPLERETVAKTSTAMDTGPVAASVVTTKCSMLFGSSAVTASSAKWHMGPTGLVIVAMASALVCATPLPTAMDTEGATP